MAAGLLAAVIALQPGCATLEPPVPDIRHQTSLGMTTVVASLQQPMISFEGFSRGALEGAARTAGGTFLSCAQSMSGGGCAGAYCGAVVIVMLAICGIASAVGGAIGAASSPSAESVQAAEAGLYSALQGASIRESLRNEIAALFLANGTASALMPEAVFAQDYRPLAAKGIDTVIETTLTKAGTRGDGLDSPLLLYMHANIRLIRTRDNAVMTSTDYIHEGSRLKLSEWAQNDAARLLDELKTGYEALALHIYDGVFRLYPFPDRSPQWGGLLSAAFGLAPVFPPTRGQLTGDPVIGNRFEWTTVDNLQPTLQWQSFPRQADIADAPADMARVRNVRYDVIVARERNLAPAEVIYRRQALSTPEHKLEVALLPGTRYFWTVRARFELDGRERVTAWGSTHFVAREQYTAPSRFSYRFRTP